MEITFDDFVRSCPSAMAPDTLIFEAIQQLITFSADDIKEIVTPDIFEALDDPEKNQLEILRNHVITYICATAFYNAIPQLDLVMTSNGFGVVSNQNVVPASSDRVERLRTALHRTSLIRLDRIIAKLRHLKEWQGSDAQRRFFVSLFWSADHMRLLGVTDPTRDDLDSKIGDLMNAELEVETLISPEQLAEFRRLESSGEASPIQSMAIDLCRRYVATIVCERPGIAVHSRNLLRFIENHISEFEPYSSSQTYKANHFEPYQNKKDDTCFFFG